MIGLVIFAAALSVGVGLGAAYYFYLLLWQPERTLIPRRETKFQEVCRYALIAAAVIGLGYMIYKGVEGMLWWLPRKWTVLNEDGEREWIGHGIALMIAGFGSIFSIQKLSELATEVVRSRQNQR